MHFLDHIWTFVTDVINVYIDSIILQILMNMVVHVEAFKSGLVLCVWWRYEVKDFEKHRIFFLFFAFFSMKTKPNHMISTHLER